MSGLSDDVIRRVENRCVDTGLVGSKTFLDILLEQVVHRYGHGDEREYDQAALLRELAETEGVSLLDFWIVVGDHCNYAYSQVCVGKLVCLAPGYVFLSAEWKFDNWFNTRLRMTGTSVKLRNFFQGRVRQAWFGGKYRYVLETFAGEVIPLRPAGLSGIQMERLPAWLPHIRRLDVCDTRFCRGIEPSCWEYMETVLGRYLYSGLQIALLG